MEHAFANFLELTRMHSWEKDIFESFDLFFLTAHKFCGKNVAKKFLKSVVQN